MLILYVLLETIQPREIRSSPLRAYSKDRWINIEYEMNIQ